MYSCACNHVISLLCFFNQSTITGWFGINSEWIVHIMVKCLSHNEMLLCCRIPGGKRNTLVLPIDRSLVSRDRQLHVGCSRPRCHRGRDNVSQSVPRDAFPYSAPSGLQLPWTGSDTLGHHDAGKWQRPATAVDSSS